MWFPDRVTRSCLPRAIPAHPATTPTVQRSILQPVRYGYTRVRPHTGGAARALQSALLALALAGTIGCSGGGGGDRSAAPTPPANQPPTVAAGADQSVDEGAAVTLRGQVSDADSTPTIRWTQTGGPDVDLSDTSALSPTFVAPSVAAQVTLSFRLTADDGSGAPVSDDVNVVVQDTLPEHFLVDVQSTSGAISAGPPHVVAPPRTPSPAIGSGAESGEGKLFVFLPGTGEPPESYSTLVEHSAGLGYAAVGLAYANDVAVNSVCSNRSAGADDPDCEEFVRSEIITGEDRSPLVEVARPDSIENRLLALLEYLQRNDTSTDWGRFVDGGAIDWSHVAVGGHSQGGGHAALLGNRARVDRVLLFSATEPARWTRKPGATPSSRYFGFAHASEVLFPAIVGSWDNLGLPAPLETVDEALPASSSQQFVTARATCNGDASEPARHQCTSTDRFTPRDAQGGPEFAPVWNVMLTAPGLAAPDVDVAVGASFKSYMDPEILGLERLAVFIDQADASLWLARLDPNTGLFRSATGLDIRVDTDVVPFGVENRNGPEFGVDQDGWAVFYARRSLSGMPIQIWRAALSEGNGFETVELTSGEPHHTALAAQRESAPSTRIAAITGDDPERGPIVAFDEASPSTETPLVASREFGVNVSFFPDRDAAATAVQFNDARQVVTVDLETGAQVPATSDAGDKTDVQVFSDPETGGILLAAVRDRTSIGIWAEVSAGSFEFRRELPLPAASTLPNVRSLEAFEFDGRAWLAANVYDATMVSGFGEIWVYPVDGQPPVKCNTGVGEYAEPEPFVVSGRVFVFYSELGGLPAWKLRRCVPDL